MKKITNIIFSYWTMAVLLLILGIGAAVATFIENDYGTDTARILVYNHKWYELIMVLTCINLMGIVYKTKMWKKPGKFLFHISFVVILIGAAITRYYGYEGILHIREGYSENRMLSLKPYLQVTIKDSGKTYYKEYVKELSALGNDFEHNIKFADKSLNVKYDDYTFAKKGRNTMGILKVKATIDGDSRELKLVGKSGMKGIAKVENFRDTEVILAYGSKTLTLPFSIVLRDFQLDRYPGSMSPSSYASEVTVVKKDGREYDYRVYMNNTLHEGNFLFFQSSYDQDEKGTILSVNNDPGKWPTYFGYFLLTLGLVVNMFEKNSRFYKLTSYLKKNNIASFLLALSVVFACTNTLEAKDYKSIKQYLAVYETDSLQVADKFSKLVVQNNQGRMEPVSTLNKKIVNKLTSKNTIHGLNSDQIVLGMLSRPEIWRHVPMIKIKTPKLKKLLGIDEDKKYIKFSDVFKNGKYILQEEANIANRMVPSQRGTFEKDILRVDERLNIAYMTYNGNIFNLFPEVNDKSGNDKWHNPLDAINNFKGQNQIFMERVIRGFISAVVDERWDDAREYIGAMSTYQNQVGEDIIPDKSIIEGEILFNNFDIFPKLTLAYVFVGFILFIVAFITVFNEKLKSTKVNMLFFIILSLLFAAHTFGMGFRWYVSGHAPWSDTYESLLYISWSAMFAGLVFFRKSILTLSATVIVAGIFMFTAHLSHIDPQITNLVPVLKSYWLTIHVSILTGSYGFLGLGAILGFMALLLFIFRSEKRPHIDDTIKHITVINEVALIIGLSAIVIGNFLGAVWANESWGRYWGWDPKETWAYVAIVAYIIVLHLRFMKPLNNPYVFSVASLLAFSTILMTYFGVNFYLSGMHSYATGDPVPIPTWVYYLAATVFIVIALAFRKRKLDSVIKNSNTKKKEKK